jgi:hypothetical protein
MTGPEHYEKAEQLLAEAAQHPRGTAAQSVCIDRANVHGLLALTAATALQSYYASDDAGSGLDADAWQETVGES